MRNLLAVLVALGLSAYSSGAEASGLAEEMGGALEKLDSEGLQAAEKAIGKASQLGGERLCDVKPIKWQKSLNASQKRLAFRYFANLGVGLRKAKRYDEAAWCIHQSASLASNSREASGVLYEAAMVVEHVSPKGWTNLVGEPADKRFYDNLLFVFYGDKPDFALEQFPHDLTGLNQVAHSSDSSMKELSVELLKASPIGMWNPPDSGVSPHRGELKAIFLDKAWEWFPSRATRKALQASWILGERKMPKAFVEDDVVGGRVIEPLGRFENRQEAEKFVADRQMKKSVHCDVARKMTPEERESKGITMCSWHEFRLIKSEETKDGVFEIFHSKVVTNESVNGACESDRGRAIALFRPKVGKVDLVDLGVVNGRSPCGPAGYGDEGRVGVGAVSKGTNALEVRTINGAYESAGKGVKEGFVRWGVESVCHYDNGLKCVSWKYWGNTFRHTRFPDLKLNSDGSLRVNLENVDSSIWSTHLQKLSSVPAIFENLEEIQDAVRTAYK